jgi:hypothetical protein
VTSALLERVSRYWTTSRNGQTIPRQGAHVFWLTGQAGSGKTTIAYTITKRFVKGGNFLCSRQFKETRERTRIVPTIAYQLDRQCQSYAVALHNAEKFDAIYHDVPKQLNDLLLGPWQQFQTAQNYHRTLIVLDALDKIKGSAFLRDLLTVIEEHNLKGFKFLVTSGPDPEVVALCKSIKVLGRTLAATWTDRVSRDGHQDVPEDQVAEARQQSRAG